MKSYLINLASRPDRLELATKELNRVGFDPERFNAYSEAQAGGNRMLAFNKSQYYCIKKAVEEGHDRFAVFEDDVVFTEGAKSLIEDVIKEWDWENHGLLHLGCNIIGMSTTEWKMPVLFTSMTAYLFNCWQTHAIIWTKEAAELFLAQFPYHGDEYAVEGLMIFDEWLRQNMYNQRACFVMRPMVAYQRPDFSDLNQAHSDYTSCFELGNKYLMSL